MSNKKLRSNQSTVHQGNSLVYWITGLFIIGFLFIAPYFKALFNGGIGTTFQAYVFNQPIYTAMIFTFSFALLFGLVIYKDQSFLKQRWLPTLLVWLLPASYLGTYFVSAVSQAQTTQSILIHCMYGFFFIMSMYWVRSERGTTYLTSSIMGSGYVIVLFGLVNWFGKTFYNDAVILEPGRLRLTSVFQYANTYAAFLIALLLAALYLLIQSNHRLVKISSAFMIVPIFVSLMLTYSRGGLVILPVTAFVVLFFLEFRQQIFYVLYMIVAAIITILVSPHLTTIGMDQYHEFKFGTFAIGLLIVIVASFIFAGIAHFSDRLVYSRLNSKSEKNSHRFSRLYIPVSGVILGALTAFLLLETSVVKILPDSIQQRITNINFDQHSVLERATFYRDSMKIVSDYPVFGAGGGAWSVLYEQYQNNPYTSTQAHSFYIQQWIETGLVGLIILLVLIVSVYWLFLRKWFKNEDDRSSQHIVFFIISFSILIHSIIDFNMSYVYIGSLVFICFGAMTGLRSSRDEISNVTNKNWRRWILPTFTSLLALSLLITSIRLHSAGDNYVRALRSTESGDLSAVIHSLNKAVDQYPHPDYVGFRARIMLDIYRQTGDEQFASEFLRSNQKLHDLEPFSRVALDHDVQYYLYHEQYSEAAEALQQLIELVPWDISIYETLISVEFQMADLDIDDLTSEPHLNNALAYYDEILQRKKLLMDLPENQLPGKDFSVTPTIAATIGQIYLYTNENDEVIQLLHSYKDMTELDEYQILMRFYLAATILDGNIDQDLYDTIIAEYPDEEIQISNLVQAIKN